MANVPPVGDRLQTKSAAIHVPGAFGTPLLYWNQYYWGFTLDGSLLRVSRFGGAPRTWAQFRVRQFGLNRPQLASAGNAGFLLLIDRMGVTAVSLATAAVTPVFSASAGAEVLANAKEAELSRFQGLSASGDRFAFLVRAAGGSVMLHTGSLLPGSASEQPFAIPGRQFLAPAISGRRIAACSDEQVTVYDWLNQTSATYPMRQDYPSFEPMFSRSTLVNVPLGQTPFAVGGGDAPEVFLAGSIHGEPGILAVSFESMTGRFEPVARGAAVCAVRDRGLWVNNGNELRVFGSDLPPGRASRLGPGMPVNFDGSRLVSFQETSAPGRHQIAVAGNGVDVLTFDDPACNVDSCGGVAVTPVGLSISYLALAAQIQDRSARVAQWEWVQA